MIMPAGREVGVGTFGVRDVIAVVDWCAVIDGTDGTPPFATIIAATLLVATTAMTKMAVMILLGTVPGSFPPRPWRTPRADTPLSLSDMLAGPAGCSRPQARQKRVVGSSSP